MNRIGHYINRNTSIRINCFSSLLNRSTIPFGVRNHQSSIVSNNTLSSFQPIITTFINQRNIQYTNIQYYSSSRSGSISNNNDNVNISNQVEEESLEDDHTLQAQQLIDDKSELEKYITDNYLKPTFNQDKLLMDLGNGVLSDPYLQYLISRLLDQKGINVPIAIHEKILKSLSQSKHSKTETLYINLFKQKKLTIGIIESIASYRLKRGDLEGAEREYGINIPKLKLKQTPESYALGLTIYLKNPEKLKVILNGITRDNLQSHPSIVSKMIEIELNNSNSNEKAKQLFEKDIEANGIREEVANHYLYLMSRTRYLHLFPETVTYIVGHKSFNSLPKTVQEKLTTTISVGITKLVNELTGKLLDSLNKVNPEFMNSLGMIRTHIRYLFETTGEFDSILPILKKHQKNGTFTFEMAAMVINSAGLNIRSRISSCFYYIRKMVEESLGTENHPFFYHKCLVETATKCNRLKNLSTFLDRMHDQGLCADNQLCNTVIRYLSSIGDTKTLYEFLTTTVTINKEMENDPYIIAGYILYSNFRISKDQQKNNNYQQQEQDVQQDKEDLSSESTPDIKPKPIEPNMDETLELKTKYTNRFQKLPSSQTQKVYEYLVLTSLLNNDLRLALHLIENHHNFNAKATQYVLYFVAAYYEVNNNKLESQKWRELVDQRGHLPEAAKNKIHSFFHYSNRRRYSNKY